MPLLNVSFGIFAFGPFGWLFMAVVIVLEIFLMARMLLKANWNRKVGDAVLLANVVSGAVGIALSLAVTGGWWLVLGIPWVSSHEVNFSNPANVWGFVLYYLVALLLSILIEGVVNYFMLRKRHQPKRIIGATVLVNLASYMLGSIVLYAFSFS